MYQNKTRSKPGGRAWGKAGIVWSWPPFCWHPLLADTHQCSLKAFFYCSLYPWGVLALEFNCLLLKPRYYDKIWLLCHQRAISMGSLLCRGKRHCLAWPESLLGERKTPSDTGKGNMPNLAGITSKHMQSTRDTNANEEFVKVKTFIRETSVSRNSDSRTRTNHSSSPLAAAACYQPAGQDIRPRACTSGKEENRSVCALPKRT